MLGLADTAAAMDQVPSVGRPDQGNLATGTADERAAVETAVAARTGASRCNTVRKQDETSHDPDEHKSLSFTPQRHRVQPSATACEEAASPLRKVLIQQWFATAGNQPPPVTPTVIAVKPRAKTDYVL